MFKLPHAVVTEVESMFNHFLWKEGRVPVAKWETCCLPWLEGGLGLRRIADGNTVGILMCFWQLVTGREAIWVRWLTAKYLQSNPI